MLRIECDLGLDRGIEPIAIERREVTTAQTCANLRSEFAPTLPSRPVRNDAIVLGEMREHRAMHVGDPSCRSDAQAVEQLERGRLVSPFACLRMPATRPGSTHSIPSSSSIARLIPSTSLSPNPRQHLTGPASSTRKHKRDPCRPRASGRLRLPRLCIGDWGPIDVDGRRDIACELPGAGGARSPTRSNVHDRRATSR